MTITTVTSRELNQDISKVKKVCEAGPVYVTNRGNPTHVMMTFDEYQKLVGNSKNIVELLAMNDAEIEFEPPKLQGNLFKVADLT
ncbi:MAG: type II toxin-antitoxin system Phd/YefM family antitoxin [Proteobacteria bacterium]|nr:type II toxin-antitoxin system Phd/YefM family antitoxin [Pseudomonadota bacterium]